MSAQQKTLFKGGKIFTSDGSMVTDHGVLIDGGHIVEVAPVERFQGFDGDIVEMSGATLLPGLADCHVHLIFTGEPDPYVALTKARPADIVMTALKNAQISLASGLTMLRDCGGKDYLEFSVRDAIRRGDFIGPTIHAAGKMICMTGGHGNRIGRIADGEDEVKKAVREQVHAGCDLIKIMATGGVMTPGVNPEDAHYTQGEMTAGVEEAKRFHKRSASHAQGTEGILNAVRAGISSIEHGILMSEKCYEEMLENGTFLVPTLSALQNILDHADKGIPAYVVEKAQRLAQKHKESFQRFYELGGKIAMGTDAGTPFNKHGENLQELDHMVAFGMTPVDAILTASANAADLMGLQDHGNIAAGMVADFLMVNGDPTEDITAVTDRANHRAVYKSGRKIVGADLAAAPLAIAAE